ncbi:MAG TPA: cation:proton antiporter [Candidatus Altiarchaeales archaeon]|nr:cation:proton antiporter [Candidatus Altiarchaeales archaeon]
MELFFLLTLVYLVSITLGNLLEKIRIPWLFAPLFLGLFLGVINFSFQNLKNAEAFEFIANLGMLFLLFMIGFELEVKEILKLGRFIFLAMFFIILLDAALGSVVIHFIGGVDWLIAIICALSFATVGEAVLAPILDEFKLLATRFGAIIVGIGTLDDIFEVFTILLATSFIGIKKSGPDPFMVMLSLSFLFFMTFAMIKFKKVERKLMKTPDIEHLFIVSLFILFFFLLIGRYAESEAIGALLAGIGVRNFIPREALKGTEEGLRLVVYGLLAPLFFLWVGMSVRLDIVFNSPLLTLSIFLVSVIAKISASILAGFGKLSLKESLLLGTGLSVRFSTGLVVAQLLLKGGIIQDDLFSALVAASALSTIFVPIIFGFLVKRWRDVIDHLPPNL